jgi:hypothetical protein
MGDLTMPALARLALATLLPFAAADPAAAIAKCKVKVDQQTGDLLVSAKSVSNNPTWGPIPQSAIFAFEDVVGCFQGGKLKNCRLGPPGSVSRTTPPEACFVYLADDGAEDCAVRVPGCTPGIRPGLPTESIWLQNSGSPNGVRIEQTGPAEALYIAAEQNYAIWADTLPGSAVGGLRMVHRGATGHAGYFELSDPAATGAALYAKEESDAAVAAYLDGNIVVNGIADFTTAVDVGGTLTKASGSFRIDHPQDPANRTLSHSFVESPDMLNVYNGNATLGADGRAAVPAYFEALNRDFRYQLTALGAPAPNLHVAKEIAGNRFEIAGGPPGARVSWQVTGVRRDPWAEAHRVPVEEEKSLAERGTYLHPELYGQPESLRRGAKPAAATLAAD